ncbi:hypothetical protein METHB2_100071 [Candidatus Methylobacter favarea]|uniref:Uncharacterized protein n=1 Tax=Candidatus Methylobacter favarea TaxID=2707345 RepID=A0A8S0WLY7_9GAMM|nr:hypothetical protein METHB2_100071 [Candidatus Methylobacter favarea]
MKYPNQLRYYSCRAPLCSVKSLGAFYDTVWVRRSPYHHVAIVEYSTYKSIGNRPIIGNIILACHSGAGRPMLEIVTNANQYSAHIQECWGFDCLYSGCMDKETKKGVKCSNKSAIKLYSQPLKWIKWAETQKDKGKRLFIYYLGSTSQESKYLCELAKRKKLFNTTVFVQEYKAKGHCLVPTTHWQERLSQLGAPGYRMNNVC